jgi:glycerol-3-phosphate dehydrogenase
MQIQRSSARPPMWTLPGQTFASNQEVLDRVQLEGDSETPAVYRTEVMSASHSLTRAVQVGAVGLVGGLAASALGLSGALSSALVGGAVGLGVGAWVGRSKPQEVAVAGRLVPGLEGLAFRPNNVEARTLDLATGSPESFREALLRAPSQPQSLDEIRQLASFQAAPATRQETIARLKDSVHQPFDMLVIGGGATGTGTSLEAARRGLSVAGVEAYDFSSGTSSKSTKLIHGGVRYLEKAVKKLDREQYELVKEGLEERGTFLQMAPHLTDEVRLVTPCYKWSEIPYFYAGLWLYDRIAGQAALSATEVMSKDKTVEQLPQLKREGLKGAVVYSDGEFNDSRMNVSLATTAAAHGAAMANYVEVLSLIKENGKVVGVEARDKRSGEEFPIRAKQVINATGPFIDGIRQMDDASSPKLVAPSAGTHILIPKLKLDQAVLVPEAPNGSVAFLKPFEGGTLVGTTEEKTELTITPQTTQEQVEYLRNLANSILSPDQQIASSDITSVWTGIRPLVKNPKQTGPTQELVRNHLVDVSPSGLVTVAGGKWTNFARMAADTVDAALAESPLGPIPSQRQGSKVVGAEGYQPKLSGWLQEAGLDAASSEHLARNYGDRAVQIFDLIQERPELGQALHPKHPYLAAEVVYTTRQEMAQTPVDVLARRTRLTFVDEQAALEALPRVNQLMAEELQWTPEQAQSELNSARSFLENNGLHAIKK